MNDDDQSEKKNVFTLVPKKREGTEAAVMMLEETLAFAKDGRISAVVILSIEDDDDNKARIQWSVGITRMRVIGLLHLAAHYVAKLCFA